MRVLVNGPEPDEAALIVILLHGRGADGEDIMGLSAQFEDEDVCWLAPTAMNQAWYPGKFMDRRASNEPYLTLSTEQVKGLVDQFPPGKVVLAGFSQGACLTADILARYNPELAGAWMFSGGLIGHDDEMPEPGEDLKSLPVIVTGSQRDPHIPLERMEFTVKHLKEMGCQTESLFYDLDSHQIVAEEMDLARKCLELAKERAGV